MMAKKQKDIRPFFKLRFEINDTLEALCHEILMSIQAMETTIALGGMSNARNIILYERAQALRKLCMSSEEKS